ncbi:hypothetical protein [uncultured Abyssibacter sp.]|uniref:hypothetical protein n=1 Tax=uncultured Abyssibacter sp. TaxID=2320202 RepID=UPI0032B294D9
MMISRLAKLTGIVALGCSATALAHNYTYIDALYLNTDPDVGDDYDGFGIGGAAAISPDLHLFGQISDQDELERLTAGLALNHNLQPGLDLVAGASFESIEIGNSDDTGIGLRADLRWLVPNSRFELSPGLRYVDLYDDGDTALRLAGLYGITPRVKLQAAMEFADDADTVSAGARFEF